MWGNEDSWVLLGGGQLGTLETVLGLQSQTEGSHSIALWVLPVPWSHVVQRQSHKCAGRHGLLTVESVTMKKRRQLNCSLAKND